MITRPRLKAFLSVFPLSKNAWGLRGGPDEVWRVKLTDERAVRAFGALLPYLDGTTARDEILNAVAATGVHAGAAEAVLNQLETFGLLEEADSAGLAEAELERYDEQICFFSRFGQQGGARFQAALRDAHVGLVADGSLGESLYQRLAGAGFGALTLVSRQPERVAEWPGRLSGACPRTSVVALDPESVWLPEAEGCPSVFVVAQQSHDPHLLESMDALSKRRRLPWLLVRSLDLKEGWVGPLFVPGETASYLSLEARLRSNMARFPEYLAFDAHVRGGAQPAGAGALRAALDMLSGIAVIELIKFVSEIKVPELLGKFLTVNLWTWETELHEVLRLPSLDRDVPARPTVHPRRIVSDEIGAAAPRTT